MNKQLNGYCNLHKHNNNNKKQKAVRQLLNAIPEASEIKDFISENNADTKMLDEWLWERIYEGRDYLQMEREQIVNAFKHAQALHSIDDETRAEQYYQNTFKP